MAVEQVRQQYFRKLGAMQYFVNVLLLQIVDESSSSFRPQTFLFKHLLLRHCLV